MPNKTWKSVERRIAELFKGTRNSLSGRNSKAGTSGDVIHDKLYIEIKHRSKIPFYSTWEDTREKAKLEKKIPVVVIHKKGSREYLAIVDARWLASILD